MALGWILAGTGLLSALFGAGASTSAANTQAKSANQASQVEQNQFNQTQANLAPYMQAGQMSLADLSGLLQNPNSSLNTPFSAQQFQASPGYQWQLGQGIDAIQNSASARGGVMGGNTLKALDQFGQGVANQDYWNQYNAYTQNQNDIFNRLFSVAGVGANAASGVGNFGASTANNIGNNLIGAGNATAAGTVGAAGAVNNAANSSIQNYLLNNLLQNGGGTGGFAQFNNNTGSWITGPQGFPA